MERAVYLVCVAVAIGLIACGDDGSPGADAATSDAATTDAAQPDGNTATCGGFAGTMCSGTELCDFTDNLCGGADGDGMCVDRPVGCDDNVRPVCGCDGQVYSNECEARTVGVDVSDLGGCTIPAGSFACGHQICDLATEYCQVQVSDVVGLPNGYACPPSPVTCGATPDCACLAGEPCGDMCMQGAEGGFTLTCPGG